MGRSKLLSLPLLAATFISVFGVTLSQNSTSVPVPPLITDDPPKVYAFREEESFQMLCVASGDPDPEYEWEFNSEPFDPSGVDGRVNKLPGVGTLVFNRPIARDEGLYQCFAKNKFGRAASVKVVLRRGDLQAFKDGIPHTHRPQIGRSLQLRCNPPVSYPQPVISWTLVSNRESKPVEFDDRVSIDPIGNLNFANIIPADDADGASYACEIWNNVMRRQQRGSFAYIKPSGSIPVNVPPAIMWAAPQRQIALRGKEFRVKCIFAGNPTPRVTWNRENKPMPPRKTEESYGQEMVIKDVQYDDAGVYECEGINQEAMTPVRRSFNVMVESAPHWVSRPESVSAAESEEARFECEADGKPRPVISWFINGKPIATVKDDPRRKVQGGVITFKNLTIKDPMVFQCNASNTHGYIFANAYLNVQSEPPTILDPPKEQKVAEGKTVNISCKVYGSPRPQVVWSKGNEQLTGGNFKVLEDGSLQIQTVSLVDAGRYTCTATNKLDTASATGTLVVRRKTHIQTGPLDVMIYENTEVKFTCTATTDAEEVKNLKIIWKKNGSPIDFALAQRMFKNDLDNSLTISGTMSRDTAAYACMATNGLDEDEQTAQLIVQGVPDPPEKIKVNCSDGAIPALAVIEWMPAKENYAPILNFVIQYNTTFAPDQWITIADNITQTARIMTVPISPYGNYTFRVLARNKIGLSQPGIVSDKVCRTLPAAPTKNPDNVIGEGDERDNLVIFWTPIAPIDQNGKNFHYIITWQRADLEKPPKHSHTIEGAPYYHHIVPGTQETYKPFIITVQSSNEMGSGPTPTAVIGYSGEDMPTVRVSGITYIQESLTGREVILQWPPINETNVGGIRGYFRGYRVEYWVRDDKVNTFREVDHIVRKAKSYPRPRPKRSAAWEDATTTPIPIVTVRLTNMRPNSNMVIHVRVLNKYYAGLLSDPPIEIRTPEGPPGPPRMLEVISRGPTHFDLRWEAPVETNGVLLGYNISYQTITRLTLGRLQYREEGVPANATMIRLTALKPDMYYRVYLAAKTKGGKGEPMFMDAQTSPAGAPNPPTFSFVGDVGETYVDVRWIPAHGNNPGSVFYVQYRIRGWFEWKHSRDVALRHDVRIEGLDPGKTYQMRVVAKNGQGLESPTEWQEVTTAGIPWGGVEAGRSVWFYMLFLSLIVIALLMVAFMFCKRKRDDMWEDEERKREIQALEMFEKARQAELEASQQYSRESANLDPGVGYDSEEEDDDEDAGFKESIGGRKTPVDEQAPPLPDKKQAAPQGGYVNPDIAAPHTSAAVPTTPAAASYSTPGGQPQHGYDNYQEGYDYSQYPEGSYPEGAYAEGYYDENGQYYPGYGDGQYYDPNEYPEYYAEGYYTEDGQYVPYEQQQGGQQQLGVQVRNGKLHLDSDPRSGGSSAI